MARQHNATLKRQVASAERDALVAKLYLVPMPVSEIQAQTGMARSSIYEALHRYRRELPADDLEKVRQRFIRDGEFARDRAMELAVNEDPNIAVKGVLALVRTLDTLARVTGLVKAAPPMVHVNIAPTVNEMDPAGLNIEEIKQLQAIRRRLAASSEASRPLVVEAQGHEVLTEGVADGQRDAGEGAGE